MIGQTNHNAGLTKARADQLYFVKSSGSITSGYLGIGSVNGINFASGSIVRGLLAGSNVTITFDGDGIATIDATISGTISVSSLTVASGLSLNSGTIYNGSNPAVIGISSGGILEQLIANNAISSGKIGSGQIGSIHIASGAISNNSLENNSIIINDATILLGSSYTLANLTFGSGLESGTYNGSGAATVAIASGGITNNMLASGSVTSEKLASGIISSLTLGSGQVASGNIGNNAVVSGSIASGQISQFHIASGSITADHIASGAVISSDVADNAVVSGKIASGAISWFNLASGAITLSSGQVVSGYIGDNAVVSGSVGSGQIGSFHITSGLITAGSNIAVSIVSGNLYQISATVSGGVAVNPLNVSSGLILNSGSFFDGSTTMTIGLASGGVSSQNLADGSVGSTALASGSVGLNNFASGLSFVLSGSISGISSGSVTSGLIGNEAVVSGSIASGQIGYIHLNSGFVYTTDLTVSLSSGKTFGRYINGETIPSSGKTPVDVIQMAIAEPKSPDVFVSGSPISYVYGLSSFANTISYQAVINTIGASSKTATVEYRKNNTGSWSILYSGAIYSGSVLHSGTKLITDSEPFNYRYTFVDSSNMSGQATANITVSQPTSPTVNLTRSPTSYLYGATSISNTLTYSATVNTNGASGSLAVLEFRRGGAGAWTSLYSGSIWSGAYIHTDTNTFGNNSTYDYQYTFIDSANMSGRASASVSFGSYTAPSITLYISGSAIASPETNSLREIGNYSSQLGGIITRNSSLVNMQSYQLQFNYSGASWINIGSSVNISGSATANFGPITHNDSLLSGVSTVNYRVSVTDQQQTTNGSSNTINFLNMIWYGPSSSITSGTATSANIRSLSNRIFTSGSNPFTLNTGTTEDNFAIAMPSGKTITSVIDTTALNTNITTAYLNNQIDVSNAGGNPVNYNVYILDNATPYTENHEHVVTRN